MRLFCLLSVIFATALSGCSPVERSENEEAQLRPLSVGEQAEFEKIIEGFGRIEQIVRLKKANDQKISVPGLQDPTAQAMLSRLESQFCDFSSELAAPTKLMSSNFSVAITSSTFTACPALASITMKGGTSAGSLSLAADWLTQDQELSNLNYLSMFSFRGSGDRKVENAEHRVSAKVTFKIFGRGTLATGESFVAEISRQSEQWTTKDTTTMNGVIHLRVTAGTRVYDLQAKLAENGAEDRSVYLLNGSAITAEAFRSYFSRLGLIVGILASSDAG